MKNYKERLGRKGWDFLHEMARGWYNNGIQSKEEAMYKFWKYFSLVYPCEVCSNHMKKYLRDHPVDARNNISYRNGF